MLGIQDFKQPKGGNKDFSYWFATKEEAINFVEYLKLDVVRFMISIYKVACDIKPHYKIIPFLDYTKRWSEDDVMSLLCITEEEQQWIKKIIPKYHKI